MVALFIPSCHQGPQWIPGRPLQSDTFTKAPRKMRQWLRPYLESDASVCLLYKKRQ